MKYEEFINFRKIQTKNYAMLVALVILFLLVNHGHSTADCKRQPNAVTGKATEPGRYRIDIESNPESYNPGQRYTVILQSRSKITAKPNTFNGFTLSFEPAAERLDQPAPQNYLSAGTFKILPEEENTKFDERCPNTVVHSSHVPQQKIKVWWVAPDPGIGCVLFKASILEENTWYQDRRGLVYKFCQNEDPETNDVLEKCFSCKEAVYEMIFEGMWTYNNHPLHYPNNMWVTRFSDVIGASHASDYRVWELNTNASAGLIDFSENGDSSMLEFEIKANRTRTVIKAKGLSYPNIAGKTYATFRVDPEHHLLSLISLIKPSPDWFVGLSGYELCDMDGNWISERKIALYPHDLGKWGDVEYEMRTKQKEEFIHKIDHSSIPESPFFTNNGLENLKPMARVHLIKTREFKNLKNCDTGREELLSAQVLL